MSYRPQSQLIAGQARNRRRPIFIVKECGKTHFVRVRATNRGRVFRLVQDTGSENTYIDMEIAQAWGLMKGKLPLVPYKESTTVDSNGAIHKSLRLLDVHLEILCPDGVFRGSLGPVEVGLDSRINKFGRLYGVSHMRTLRDKVQYITDFTYCGKKNNRTISKT
jgi:hypothetical protein